MKILFATTLSGTVNAFLIPHINLLLNQGHQIDIVCNVGRPIDSSVINRGCRVFDLSFNRSPVKKENYLAYKKLKKLIKEEGYDWVHTHTPVASALVRLACRNIRNVKVFYTAHGFHFFNGAPIRNWLIYYPIERWLARYTDLLITINNEDYSRAKRSFKAKKIKYIPGVGLNVSKFREVNIDKQNKRRELGLSMDDFVLLSVGELVDNKNHMTVIQALEKLNNPRIKYIICGHGPLEKYHKELKRKMNLDKHVLLLGYRNDVSEIYKVSDVFIFPSKREGLGMAALEAMAAGLPIITSNVHGIVDYSIDGKTGYTCRPTAVDEFARGINNLFNDLKKRNQMGENNSEAVDKYNLDNVLNLLDKIYNYELGKGEINE